MTGREPVARARVLLPALHEALASAGLAALAGDHSHHSTMKHCLKVARSAGVIAFGTGSGGLAALDAILTAIQDEAALLAASAPANGAGDRDG